MFCTLNLLSITSHCRFGCSLDIRNNIPRTICSYCPYASPYQISPS